MNPTLQTDSDSGALILALAPGRYRRDILTLPEGPLRPAPDCHVTLVGRRLADRLNAPQRQQLETFAQTLAWQVRPTNEYLLLEKPSEHPAQPPRQSIIELAAVPMANALYRYLRQISSRQWPIPPMHITAMTHSGERGIGLYSPADLDRYRKRHLSADEIRQLRCAD